MQSLQHPALKTAIALALLFAFSGDASGEKLRGSVASFADGQVRIRLEGDRVPAAGDAVTIYSEVPGLGSAPLSGDWTVARVEGNTVFAMNKGDASARPSAGQTVQIESEHPVALGGSGDSSRPQPSDAGRQPVPGGKTRLETDNYYLDVPSHWHVRKQFDGEQPSIEADFSVAPSSALLRGGECKIDVSGVPASIAGFLAGDFEQTHEQLLFGLENAKTIETNQIRKGDSPAWRIRVEYDGPAGRSRHDDDIYFWYCGPQGGIAVRCIMLKGEVRNRHQPALEEVVRSLRKKPSRESIFGADSRETAGPRPGGGKAGGENAGDQPPAAGRYMPDCDASEASKEKCKLADRMREQRQFTEAIRLYNEAIQLDPSHVCAHTGLGWTYALQGRTQSGMDQMNRTVAMFPESAKALIERGVFATNISRLDIAEADADKAILLSYCAQAYELRAFCYLKRGQHQSAVNYLDMAIKIFPNARAVYSLRAQAHRGLGNRAQAAADDAKARELQPASKHE
ncbi:MAG: tetratricopeptide repeat protein [Thermoguttaceae bacterium]|jgi:tetratricopeptide (TPR) repeat protein